MAFTWSDDSNPHVGVPATVNAANIRARFSNMKIGLEKSKRVSQ
jgi:hypothetical protein